MARKKVASGGNRCVESRNIRQKCEPIKVSPCSSESSCCSTSPKINQKIEKKSKTCYPKVSCISIETVREVPTEQCGKLTVSMQDISCMLKQMKENRLCSHEEPTPRSLQTQLANMLNQVKKQSQVVKVSSKHCFQTNITSTSYQTSISSSADKTKIEPVPTKVFANDPVYDFTLKLFQQIPRYYESYIRPVISMTKTCFVVTCKVIFYVTRGIVVAGKAMFDYVIDPNQKSDPYCPMCTMKLQNCVCKSRLINKFYSPIAAPRDVKPQPQKYSSVQPFRDNSWKRNKLPELDNFIHELNRPISAGKSMKNVSVIRKIYKKYPTLLARNTSTPVLTKTAPRKGIRQRCKDRERQKHSNQQYKSDTSTTYTALKNVPNDSTDEDHFIPVKHQASFARGCPTSKNTAKGKATAAKLANEQEYAFIKPSTSCITTRVEDQLNFQNESRTHDDKHQPGLVENTNPHNEQLTENQRSRVLKMQISKDNLVQQSVCKEGGVSLPEGSYTPTVFEPNECNLSYLKSSEPMSSCIQSDDNVFNLSSDRCPKKVKKQNLNNTFAQCITAADSTAEKRMVKDCVRQEVLAGRYLLLKDVNTVKPTEKAYVPVRETCQLLPQLSISKISSNSLGSVDNCAGVEIENSEKFITQSTINESKVDSRESFWEENPKKGDLRVLEMEISQFSAVESSKLNGAGVELPEGLYTPSVYESKKSKLSYLKNSIGMSDEKLHSQFENKGLNPSRVCDRYTNKIRNQNLKLAQCKISEISSAAKNLPPKSQTSRATTEESLFEVKDLIHKYSYEMALSSKPLSKLSQSAIPLGDGLILEECLPVKDKDFFPNRSGISSISHGADDDFGGSGLESVVQTTVSKPSDINQSKSSLDSPKSNETHDNSNSHLYAAKKNSKVSSTVLSLEKLKLQALNMPYSNRTKMIRKYPNSYQDKARASSSGKTYKGKNNSAPSYKKYKNQVSTEKSKSSKSSRDSRYPKSKLENRTPRHTASEDESINSNSKVVTRSGVLSSDESCDSIENGCGLESESFDF